MILGFARLETILSASSAHVCAQVWQHSLFPDTAILCKPEILTEVEGSC